MWNGVKTVQKVMNCKQIRTGLLNGCHSSLYFDGKKKNRQGGKKSYRSDFKNVQEHACPRLCFVSASITFSHYPQTLI